MFCLKWTEHFLTFLKRCLSILLALKLNRTKRKLFFVRYCMYLVQPRQLPMTMTRGISISISACMWQPSQKDQPTASLLRHLIHYHILSHYIIMELVSQLCILYSQNWPIYLSYAYECLNHGAGLFLCFSHVHLLVEILAIPLLFHSCSAVTPPCYGAALHPTNWVQLT